MRYYLYIIKPALVLLLAVLTVYCGYGKVDNYVLTSLTLTVVFMTAAGCVVNDYFDVKIDHLVRPEYQIVTRKISRDGAMHYFYGLTVAAVFFGLVTAWFAESFTIAGMAIVVPGLLWFYSSSYKRVLILGDVVLSLVVALIPVVIAIVANTYQAYVLMACRSLQMLLGSLICLQFVAIDQQAGDREMEVHTLAVVWGKKVTKIVIGVLCVFFLVATALAVANS